MSAGPTSEEPTRRWLGPLRDYGVASWSALGVIALVCVIAAALGALAGILVPFVVALILGTVLKPIAAGLVRRGSHPALAAALAMLVLLLAAGATGTLVVRGLFQQLPEISRQLTLGWQSFLSWGRSLELDVAWLERVRVTFQGQAPRVSEGLLGLVSSTFSGALSLALGGFFAIFFLFFVLRDGWWFPAWIARRTGGSPELADRIAALTQTALSGYFKGVAVTALVTAPIFVVPLLLLRVPLVLPIVIMYFFLSFVPFVGAWITAGFAVLIAFGTGGSTAALIVLVSLVICNGTIQTAVSSWALGSSLRMHPVSVLLATMIGGTVAGILGMVLAPPLLSAATKAAAAVKEHQQASGQEAELPEADQDADR